MSQVEESEPTEALPDEPVLTPKLSPAWALQLWHLPVIALWGVLFLVLNYIPLRGTDLWGHVAWGHWILSHHALPIEDPYLPLAQGMQVVDTAWLSQVIMAAIDRVGGPPWLSNVFALVTLAIWLITWRVLYLRSKSALASLLMVAAVFLISWSRLATIRPENFACLAFAGLWWCLIGDEVATPQTFRWRLWVGVPLIMCAWANLHGSFLVGLAVLGAYAMGTLISTAWRCRSVGRALADREVQTYVLIAELALAATCVNPYGPDLVLNAVAFARNANLREITEWLPLAYGETGAYEFVGAWVLALLLFRFSRRPVALQHALLLAVFGFATLASRRLIGWFAVCYGVTLVPLLADVLPALGSTEPHPTTEPEEPGRGFPLKGRSWNYSLLGLLLLWIPFSLSPVSLPLLGGKPRSLAQLYGKDTPLNLTEYLRANPPKGTVFAPQWWADWIIRDGPPGIVPMMTSNIHLAPRQVWRDYMQMIALRPGWQQVLGRYAIETVVVDKARWTDLEKILKRDTNWRLAYEDDRAAVFIVRRATLQPRTPAAPKEGAPPPAVAEKSTEEKAP